MNRLEPVIKLYFPDGKNYTNRNGSTEFAVECPFCHKPEKLWINLDSGLNKCWNANCEYHGKGGPLERLLAAHLGISKPEALDIISGNIDMESVKTILSSKMENYSDIQSSSLSDAIEIFPSNAELVSNDDPYFSNWLKNDRNPNWNPKWFIDRFPIYRVESDAIEDRPFLDRAIFKIETNDSYAYLAYRTRQRHTIKVLNPPNAVLSRMLFNYNNLSKDVLFVCEGFFSAARVIRAGFDAVCTFGVNMSIVQASLINESSAKLVIFLYDYGALKSAMKNASFMIESFSSNKTYAGIQIPYYRVIDGKKSGLDPDDLGSKKLRKFLLALLEKQNYNQVKSSVSSLATKLKEW